MKRILIMAMAISCVASMSLAAGQQTPPDKFQQPSAPTSPVQSIHGTIVRVDNDARSATIRDDSGQLVTVHWTEFTRINGDEIKEGNTVSLDLTRRGGQAVATSIAVMAQKPY